MGLRYHGYARHISVSWGHPPPGHSRLCLHALLSMPGRTQAFGWGRGGAGSQGHKPAPLFAQPVISIAARVCDHLQLSLPGTGTACGTQGQLKSWRGNPLAGRQRDPQAKSPLGTLARPGVAFPAEGWKGFFIPNLSRSPSGVVSWQPLRRVLGARAGGE